MARTLDLCSPMGALLDKLADLAVIIVVPTALSVHAMLGGKDNLFYMMILVPVAVYGRVALCYVLWTLGSHNFDEPKSEGGLSAGGRLKRVVGNFFDAPVFHSLMLGALIIDQFFVFWTFYAILNLGVLSAYTMTRAQYISSS